MVGRGSLRVKKWAESEFYYSHGQSVNGRDPVFGVEGEGSGKGERGLNVQCGLVLNVLRPAYIILINLGTTYDLGGPFTL